MNVADDDPTSQPLPENSPPAAPENAPSAADVHADKFNDPRAQFTRRGIWMGVTVVVLASVAAVGSIYARRTRLEKSTQYWGATTIEALQLAETIELIPVYGEPFDAHDRATDDQFTDDQATNDPVDTHPVRRDRIEKINLTAMPGLGHLRRTLLDERHYDWGSIESAGALDSCDGRTIGDKAMPGCVRLVLSDPTLERFDPIELELNLVDGFVGPSGGTSRVHFSEHVRPKLQHYFATIMNVETLRYDDRNP